MSHISYKRDEKLDPLFKHYLRDQPSISYANPNDPWLLRSIISSLEILLGRKKLEKIYFDIKNDCFNIEKFFSDALKVLGISYTYDNNLLNRVPTKGPLVVIANHPFGIVDGLVLCEMIMKIRNNFKIIIHSMLYQDKDLAQYFIPIDFSNNKNAINTNIKSKKLAIHYITSGIPIIIFPSGNVSTANKFGFGKVVEEPWKKFTAKLIKKSKASVLPIYFYGSNSRAFHIASHISPTLRTGLLANEALKQFNKNIKIEIGDIIHWNQINHIKKLSEITELLYSSVHSLSQENN